MCCADEEHAVLEQRALHLLAAAGALALAQRGEHADGAEHAAHDVVDRGAGAQRPPVRAGHVGQPAHHLHDLVEREPVLVRAGQEALVRDVDQARELRSTASRGRARSFAIRPGRKFSSITSHWPISSTAVARPLGVLMSSTTLFLLRLKLRKKPMPEARQLARLVAARRLDLDDLGAEVGEDHAAGRAHHHVGELDDANAARAAGRWRADGGVESWCHGVVRCQAVSGAGGRAVERSSGRPARQSVPCRASPCSQPATLARSASSASMSMPVSMPMLASM